MAELVKNRCLSSLGTKINIIYAAPCQDTRASPLPRAADLPISPPISR